MKDKIDKAKNELLVLIDKYITEADTEYQAKNKKLLEKMKAIAGIETREKALVEDRAKLEDERAYLEREKAANREKQAFLERKEEKLKEQAAKFQRLLEE